ncbi:MAG: hypothetical protein WBL28_06680 [Methylotenera sp.]
MPNLTLPARQLIRENIAAMLTFAFSRRPLEELYKSTFVGEWDKLKDTLFDITQHRAERACLELALLLRYLDDDEELAKYVEERSNFTFGRLMLSDDSETELALRDVANKIIHAKGFEWMESQHTCYPMLVCHSREGEKWARAEVELVNLAAVCGNLT